MRGKLEDRIDLLATDSRKPLEEVINCRAVLQIFEQRPHWNPGPAKDKSSAHRLRRSGDLRAIGPIEHSCYLTPASRHPQPRLPSLPAGIAIIALALAAMVYLALRLEKQAKHRRDHYLGFLGERAVGEELNQLLADAWSVFHDVPFHDNPNGKPFNVDHVVMGPGGLFAIETKTRRKRKASAGHEVTFSGTTLEYPWGSEDWGVKQARERAHHLGQWLSEKLQADITATPVLVLPGWFVRRAGKSDLRVINEGEIPTLFRNEHKADRLEIETVTAIRALLDERCRDVGA